VRASRGRSKRQPIKRLTYHPWAPLKRLPGGSEEPVSERMETNHGLDWSPAQSPCFRLRPAARPDGLPNPCPLIVLLGHVPPARPDLAIEIAAAPSTWAVLSVDSASSYAGMDIGTGPKPTALASGPGYAMSCSNSLTGSADQPSTTSAGADRPAQIARRGGASGMAFLVGSEAASTYRP